MTYGHNAFEPDPQPPFSDWIEELEQVMEAWKAKYGERPYGEPTLEETTGLECWRDAYDLGMSPQQAFDEDRSYWED